MSSEANASVKPKKANRARRRKKYLKIPYTYARLLISFIIAFTLVLGFSLYHLNQYQISEQASQAEYEKLLSEYHEIQIVANELKDLLDDEAKRINAFELLDKRQTDKINQDKIKFEQEFDEFSQKTEEIQQKLDELEKAKEEIIAQLKKIPYLPGISSLTLNEPVPQAVSYSSDPRQMLGYTLDAINNSASAKLVSFQALTDAFWEVKPVLENYPSMWPVVGHVTSGFGGRYQPMGGNSWENHQGLDIAVPVYTDVKATGGGIITTAGYSGGYGYLVIVDHGMGIETYYAHNYELSVSVGDRVARGQVVAKSGNTGFSTGPHVHYEVRINGRAVNPINYVILSD